MIILPTTPGGFRLVYADPAWRFITRSAKGRDRCPDARPIRTRAEQRANHAARHYETMSLDEIKAMPVGDVADPRGCVLLMWAIDPMLPHAFDVAAAWGFDYKTVGFYWIKTRTKPCSTDTLARRYPAGTGYWTRGNPEQCLLFTRGKIARKPSATNVRKLIISRRRRHSQKPDETVERIEQLCHGPYLDLFARASRPGWSTWGNENTKFD